MKKTGEEDNSKKRREQAPEGFNYANLLKIWKVANSKLTIAASDESLEDVFRQIKASKTPAVINYGASWCGACSQILPAFCRFSIEFQKLRFVYADIDECPETTRQIRYTPTFQFYRDGERVDEMYGVGEDRLRDRLWLHS